ncbi:hypothetical protein SAY87_020889 [Trapa incisa]|uniref:DNA replication licensing factor MCM4 n=1 Tax=Trapa incisa TaxID=236973 RepID=A0AAN7JR19_9MYRT|nr:hypothetical protein SAY87_020889 [Trapa incisa]
MAFDSSPTDYNGPSSPDNSLSSPIGNTFSSPGDRQRRRRRRPSTPSVSRYASPPRSQSRFAASSEASPTPSRSRRQIPATPSSTDGDIPTSSEYYAGGGHASDQMFVWGTNISVQDVNAAILRFLKNFREEPTQMDSIEEGKYMKELDRVFEFEREWIDVDAMDIFSYDPDLYNKMVRYPLEVLAIFEIVLMDMASSRNPLFEKHIQARVYNLKTSVSMRNLNPSGRIVEPTRCPKDECAAQNSMSLVHNRCSFADKQIVRLQETPDEIPEGRTPHTVSLLLHDKLVDAAKPGDRVEITGVYRAMSVRVSPIHRTVKSLFKTYVDCLHVKKTNKSRMLTDDSMEFDNGFSRIEEDTPFTEQMVKQLKELSKQPDIYERLTKSLAPNIWELDDLLGGNALTLPSGASFRGDINIILVGDPGTSKSQLLQYIHKLSPRGIYTSGKGSSAVGLTAYVSKDPETGETVLESGALLLSDKGICCIDEFDKMSDSARSMLHEVMEQQTVSIAKVGIIASLNARTSVLACANPSGPRYNPRLSVIDNIHLPPTLLSRFDLIYLILDKPHVETDRRLAKHIISLHFEDHEIALQDVLDHHTLTSYVSYARKNIFPKISDESGEALTRGYVDMRRRGNFPGSSKKVIIATPRQIESVIRLSEALARIRFSEWVEKPDVMEAFRLLEVAMQQSATDHATGSTIDMDLITTGVSASERMRRDTIASTTRGIIMEKMQLGGPSMRLLELLEELKKQNSVGEVHLNDWQVLLPRDLYHSTGKV